MEKSFNLVDEKWIKVVDRNGKTDEVSLLELFLNADGYIALAGEMPTQNMAMLRFLEGILHAMVANHDFDGSKLRISNADEALDRWEQLWQKRSFPEALVRKYFDEWHERFWLIHPIRPFYQLPGNWPGTEYKAAKLIGEISESNFKPRFFVCREGEAKNSLEFAEAARWLLSLNAFDDASGKAKTKGLPACGVAWLGKIGPISALGATIFETLMLNLVLLDDNGDVWDSAVPTWELPEPRAEERCKVPVPHDQAALLTLQSRRVQLKVDGNKVKGYKLIGGDFFESRENVFEEQMTTWRTMYNKGKTAITGFTPQQHDHATRIWRNFSVLTVADPSRHMPGVIRWMNLLKEQGVLGSNVKIGLQTVGIKYDPNNCSTEDVFADSLIFNSGILGHDAWMGTVTQAIALTTEIAECIRRLVYNLAASVGKKVTDWNVGPVEEYFFDVDKEFRRWIGSIDPASDAFTAALEEYKSVLRRIAYSNGKKVMHSRGPAAMKGHTNKDTGKYVTGASAYSVFTYFVNKTLNAKEAANEGTAD